MQWLSSNQMLECAGGTVAGDEGEAGDERWRGRLRDQAAQILCPPGTGITQSSLLDAPQKWSPLEANPYLITDRKIESRAVGKGFRRSMESEVPFSQL
jgi:hypothetical protein